MDRIRDALAGARGYLASNPDEARYTDSEAVAVAESSLRIRVTGAAGEELTADFPPSVGGTGSAPSPGWYLRAAEASCVAALVVMRAAQQGLDGIRVEVRVDSVSDDRGILGLDDGIPAGPERTRVAVRISGADRSPAELETICRWAIDHCPVVDAVRRPVPVDVEVEVVA
jgi:uncharacterized OsmC-like protein